MKNTLVLEMINDGDIELLKELLTKEIYEDNLKGGNAKSRYAAMKRYFKYGVVKNIRCQSPCKDVDFYGEKYNAFIDGFSMVLTKESIGLIESIDKAKDGYFDVEKFYNPDKIKSEENIDINSMLAKGKALGYKYTKAVLEDKRYIVKYKDDYYSLGLFDKAYNIINDGADSAQVNYIGRYSMLSIHTSVGIACILPLRYETAAEMEEGKIVLNLDEWKK